MKFNAKLHIAIGQYEFLEIDLPVNINLPDDAPTEEIIYQLHSKFHLIGELDKKISQ